MPAAFPTLRAVELLHAIYESAGQKWPSSLPTSWSPRRPLARQLLLDTSRAFPSVNEADLDQADPRCFQPFSPLGDIDDDAIPFGEARSPERSTAEMWTNKSSAPLSLVMKP
jgi:hypothetical protein